MCVITATFTELQRCCNLVLLSIDFSLKVQRITFLYLTHTFILFYVYYYYVHCTTFRPVLNFVFYMFNCHMLLCSCQSFITESYYMYYYYYYYD